MKFLSKTKAFINRLYNNQGGQLLISVFITALCFAVLYLTHDIYWATADDVEIMSVVSGYFTGSTNFKATYLNVFLGFLLKALYSITTEISWYTLFHITIILFSVISIYRLILLICNRRKISIIISVIFCILLYFSLFSFLTIYMIFTINAALIGAAAIALLFIGALNSNKKLRYLDYALSGMCIILSFLLRKESGYIVVSFWILIIGYFVVKNFIINKKHGTVKFLKSAVLIILVISISIFSIQINKNFNNKYESEYYNEFNHYRSKFLDYTSVSWHTNAELYEDINWDEDLYYLAQYNWFFLDENFNLENLKRINKETIDSSYDLNIKEQVYLAFKAMVIHPIGLSITLTIALGLMAILLFFILSKDKKQHLLKLLLICFTCGGMAIIILYLCLNGRFMNHIYQTIAFPAIVIFLAVLFSMFDKENLRIKRLTKYIFTIVAIFIMLICVATSIKYVNQDDEYRLRDRAMYDLVSFASNNPDNFYIHNCFLDTSAFVTYDNETSKPATNIMRWGSCIYYNRTYYEILDINGYNEFYSKNLYDENVYFALYINDTAVMDHFKNYLNNKFGSTEFVEIYKTEYLIIYDINKV